MRIIKVSKKYDCIVDDEDYDRVNIFKWYTMNGYICTKINKKYTFINRYIMNAEEKDLINYIDGNKLNNSKSNLRFTTRQIIKQNLKSKKKSTSIYKGVSKINNYYRTCIVFNRKCYRLGTFKSEIAAAYAYNKKAKELSKYFSLNILNLSVEELEFIYINDKIKKKCAEKQSIHKGIHWCKFKEKWRVVKRIKGIRRNFGYFKTEEQAYQRLLEVKKEHNIK
jgi:hypothetical protein